MTATYAEQRDELKAKGLQLIKERKDAGQDLTDEDRVALAKYHAEVESLGAKIAKANADAAIVSAFEKIESAEKPRDHGDADGVPEGDALKSLGEHFIKEGFDRLGQVKGVRGASVSVPEYKAATDSHAVTGWAAGLPFLTDYDRSVVQAPRPRLTVADLLGKGSISGNAISYLVEGIREGNFAAVAEGGAKPQFHYVNPTAQVDALKKIAGFIKLTDEFIEDAAFLKSEIDGRLLYDLGWFEEQQLLGGAGTGANLLGLLNRSGVQTEVGADAADNADAVFRSITKVSTGAGLAADGIVINPVDYQAFRLKKDANDQYLGGGFFTGQYGNGTLQDNPPLWGLRTVVTPAIAAGTVLVGAFSQAATLYRKGGVRVEATISHDDDFTNNLITIRAEERVALAVRRPAGLVKLTLGA